MFIAFNVILILLAALIAYWWANQGLFSAILHLVCVIIAGAITFAFWEVLTINVLIRGTGFDDYAWGVSFLLLFTASLFVLRLVLDKLAPANVGVPHWANLTFGGAVGALSGVLTVGMFLIGAGHVQSSNSLMGYRGYGRVARDSSVGPINSLWVPFDKIASDFYSWMSVHSLRSDQPLQQYTPEVYKQATLLRDSFASGKGKLSLQPDSTRIERLAYADLPDGPRYFVRVNFGLPAHDFGEQLTLSPSQIRLIGDARGSAEPETVHPIAWYQYSGYHKFDNVTHYLSSEPGKEVAEDDIEFKVPPGFTPRFIQIRGIRYRLPEAVPAPSSLLAGASGGTETAPPAGAANIQSALSISNDIRPISISTNMLPGGIQHVNRFLSSGDALFPQTRGRASRNLRIEGILEPEGTKCVKLDVSRGGPADIFRFVGTVEDDATFALVDATGTEYTPIGFIYKSAEGTRIKLEPARRLRTLDDVPLLPTSGSHDLELLFYITQGATLTGFRFGSADVGYCSLLIPEDPETP